MTTTQTLYAQITEKYRLLIEQQQKSINTIDGQIKAKQQEIATLQAQLDSLSSTSTGGSSSDVRQDLRSRIYDLQFQLSSLEEQMQDAKIGLNKLYSMQSQEVGNFFNNQIADRDSSIIPYSLRHIYDDKKIDNDEVKYIVTSLIMLLILAGIIALIIKMFR